MEPREEQATIDRALRYTVLAYQRAGKPARCAEHSRRVGEILAEEACPALIVTAGILHDVVEDTCATLDDVCTTFGDPVATVVAALTEDPDIEDYRERKRELRRNIERGGHRTLLVCAADKLARLRVADADGEAIPSHKLDHYERCVDMLVRHGLPGPLVTELQRRLAARLAPRPAAVTE